MDYLVDILMPVYNHEQFLLEALEGIVSQKTNFPFRLIIGEDCSKDNSRGIIEAYRVRYPHIIFPFYREKNLGAYANSRLLFKEVRSKYVATCEGDDYWIDEHKLQKQVDFLENNSGYAACCSNVYERTENDLKPMTGIRQTITMSDLVQGNSLYTISVLYKNILPFPEWFYTCKTADWIIWLLVAQKGDIYNFQETMAVYRLHNNGIWIGKGKEKNLRDMIETYDKLLANLGSQYNNQLKQGAKQYYSQLLDMLAEKKSGEIFTWTARTFFKYYDIKQFRYLARYFRNVIKPGRALTSATNG
jgi:glycosyltransferase involved in cell wall biosynthesis